MSEQVKRAEARFGLLPEPERNTGSMVTSAAINGLLVLLVFYMGAMAHHAMVVHRYEQTQLIVPVEPKEPPKPIGIFKPEQMAALLQHAPADVVPFLAIGAFAGLRHAEILRLDWAEVDLAGGHIEVKAAKAKTASRRLVPIPENLRQWLAPLHEGTGKILWQSDAKLSKQLAALAKSKPVKVKWEHNGLRHSYISYRVAQVQNVAQVALEAGNSPNIIFSNYRELVKPTDAAKWFAISPETPANVILVPKAEPAPVEVAAATA